MTGIQPLNPLIFSEADFMPPYMTDRLELTSPSTNSPTYAFGTATEDSEFYMPIDPPIFLPVGLPLRHMWTTSLLNN